MYLDCWDLLGIDAQLFPGLSIYEIFLPLSREYELLSDWGPFLANCRHSYTLCIRAIISTVANGW